MPSSLTEGLNKKLSELNQRIEEIDGYMYHDLLENLKK